jgi:hypothetical protein
MKHCETCTCPSFCRGCGAELHQPEIGRPRLWCSRSTCQALSRNQGRAEKPENDPRTAPGNPWRWNP